MELDEHEAKLKASKARMFELRREVEKHYAYQQRLARRAYEAGMTPSDIAKHAGQQMNYTLGFVSCEPVVDVKPSKPRTRQRASRNT